MGMFISVLTENQRVAAVGALGGALGVLLLDYAAALLPTEWLKQACAWLSVFRRYQSFSQGLFSLDDIIFFLSLTAVFIFLTVRVLEKKRWS
jgi:ABC-2 type transport system permease protein